MKRMLLQFCVVLFTAEFLDIPVFKISYFRSQVHDDFSVNQTYSLNEFQIVNWKQNSSGYISEPDPMLILPDMYMYIEKIMLEVDVDTEIVYSANLFKNDKYSALSDDTMILQKSMIFPETEIPVTSYLRDLRLDPEDDSGVMLNNLRLIVNPAVYDFSISQFITLILIYPGAGFLFHLQKNVDYGLSTVYFF